MNGAYEGIHSAGSLCFRRGRSSWKSLKNNNTTGGVVCPLLRKSLAPLWGGASPDFVDRAMIAKPRRVIDG